MKYELLTSIGSIDAEGSEKEAIAWAKKECATAMVVGALYEKSPIGPGMGNVVAAFDGPRRIPVKRRK